MLGALGALPLFAKEKSSWLRFLCGILLSVAAYLHTWHQTKDLTSLSQPTNLKGYFAIHSLSPYRTSFRKGYVYRGDLYFSHLKIPCTVFYNKEERPKADKDYIVEGRLTPKEGGAVFTGKKWDPCKGTFSLAEWRFLCKEKVRSFFYEQMHDEEAASFLTALITGDLLDRGLKFSFQKLGISHILVISGFHFAFLAAFAAFLFRLFLPWEKVLWALLAVVNLYFLFLGSAPSVQRAWIVIQLYLFARLWGKKPRSLQLLGLALLLELILDPLLLKNIGFQLSFLCTWGILLLFSPFDRLLSFLFQKRSLKEARELSYLSQLGLILGVYFRKALALNLAVHAAILPVLLWHFHKVPFLGFAYNLFFPFCVMLLMAFMAISLILYPVLPFLLSWLGEAASFLLTFVFYPPQALHYSFYSYGLSLPWIVGYLGTLFLGAIYLQSTFDEKSLFRVKL